MTRRKSGMLRIRMDLDGGYAEWDNFDDVVIGDRIVPRVIEVEMPGAEYDTRPGLRMTIEVVDGVPTCSRIELQRRDGQREIQAQDLRAIRLDDTIEAIVADASMRTLTPMPDFYAVAVRGSTENRDAVKAVRAMRRSAHRKIDTKLLTTVAEIYREHVESGKPVEAVERAFGTSYRSAARWVARARQEGLL